MSYEQRPGVTPGFWRGMLFVLLVDAAFIAGGFAFYFLAKWSAG